MYDVHFWSEADGTHSIRLEDNAIAVAFFLALACHLRVQAVTPPGSAQYTVTVSSTNGFNGSVAFSVSGLPGGRKLADLLSGKCSWLRIQRDDGDCSSGNGAGVVTRITITGLSGATTSGVTVYLVIQSGPDFSITATPNSQTIATPILVNTAGGFTGSISFSASALRRIRSSHSAECRTH